jgi:hypothetical protein
MRKKVIRWIVVAAAVLGIVSGLSMTADASAPSRSSLVVPPPHGFHANPVDTIDNIRVGAVPFDTAQDACFGDVTASLSVRRPQWLSSDLRFYTSARAPGYLKVCVTRFSSTATAAKMESASASTASMLQGKYPGHVESFGISTRVPHAAGIVDRDGHVSLAWISFARGPYVAFLTGTQHAEALVVVLAPQQYARLR